MAKKAAAQLTASREELEALAKEMNGVMGLDPAIKIGRKVADDALLDSIKEQMEEITSSDFEVLGDGEAGTDFFSDEAAATLKALGFDVPEKEESDEADEPEEDEEPEEEEEEVKKDNKKEAPEKTKPVDKKAAAKEVVEEEKPAPKKDVVKDVQMKGKVKVALKRNDKKVKESYTRSNALADALHATAKTPMSKGEICKMSDDLYVKNGGETSAYVSEAMFRYGISTMLVLGVVLRTDKGFKYNG